MRPHPGPTPGGAEHDAAEFEAEGGADDDRGIEHRRVGADQDDPRGAVLEFALGERTYPEARVPLGLRPERVRGGHARVEPGAGVLGGEDAHAAAAGGEHPLVGPGVEQVEEHRLVHLDRGLGAESGGQPRPDSARLRPLAEDAEHRPLG